METLSLTPARRLEGVRAYGGAADALDAAAWTAPKAARSDNRGANDPGTQSAPEPTVREALAALPNWVVVAFGGLAAALMGAMLGGALAL